MLKEEELQKFGERLQVHYLSNDSQNKFIAECSDLVKQHVLGARKYAKYYAIIVDSTPDLSHAEQTTFFLRYLVRRESRYEVFYSIFLLLSFQVNFISSKNYMK